VDVIGRERSKKSEKGKSPHVAHGMCEFVEIHTLEHPGTRRKPFLRLHLCPRDIPPRHSVGVGWTDGRGVTGNLLSSALALAFDIFRWAMVEDGWPHKERVPTLIKDRHNSGSSLRIQTA
jgi:hypothetical protein